MENVIKEPLISIIVPCYNQGQYLAECLQSILEQTYQNWECIIVNDGSPDNTEDIASNWLSKDKRFKYLYKDNGGLSSARNAGINISRGDWIQFLDCDDLLEVNKLGASRPYLNSDVDVVISGYRYFEHTEGPEISRIFGRNGFLPEVCLCANDRKDIKELFRQRNPFVVSAPIYSKRIFDKIGGFDERLKSLEDWEFNLRCVLNNFVFQHIGYQENSKTLIRLHDRSMMRDEVRLEENLHRFREICNENPDFVDQFGVVKVRTLKAPYKSKSSNLREKVKLFIPPILTVLFYKFFKRLY